jgi:CSLREA domain-containing protein
MKCSFNNTGSEVFRRNLLAAALMAAFATPGAYAATITVNTISDAAAAAGDGMCSLREAVLAVNSGGMNPTDCVVADPAEAYGINDTIILPEGTYTLTLAGLDETSAAGAPPTVVNVPDAAVGDLDLLKSVKIVGAGSGTTKIQWDPTATTSEGADRIFHAYTTETATLNVAVVIQGVTLANGKTFEVDLGVGPVSANGPDATNYYLRRAGGALAVGPAAAVVLVDPNVTGQENSEGRGGSKKPVAGEEETGGATYTLTLSDVMVESNNAQGDGGGIYTAAAMTATNTIVRNNTALTNGGGVYNEGATSVIASTVSGNKAEGGGGFFGTGSNTVNFAGVTLSGNTAVGGGGISGRSGVTMNIVNSTISGNIGSDVGAGLYTNGSANLNFVTIARNLAGADSPDAGSGINLFPAGSTSLTLKNVLIEGNKKNWTELLDAAAIAALPTANCGTTGPDVFVTSQGSNLSSDASCDKWLTAATDKKSVDPKLDVLADNGGPTLTHKLLAGSPAMAAGTADAAVTVDQRGVARDAVPDIGAYEDPAPVLPPATDTTAPVAPPATDTGTSSSSDDGGGGCTVNPNAAFDPGLLGMLAAAVSGLFLRRRRQGKAD